MAFTGGASSSPILESKSIPEQIGVSVHFRTPLPDGGWSVDDQQLKEYEAQMDQIVELGVKNVRFDNAWQWTDKKKGKYDFAPHHRIMDALKKRGLRAVTLLVFHDPRFEAKLSIQTQQGRDAYAEFCGQIVGEFKGQNVVWEMWNEPNIPGFWESGINAEEYMKAAKAAMIAMRKADPECLIVGPASCTIDVPFLQVCIRDGLLDLVSAVSVHSYCEAPEVMFSKYLHLRNLMGSGNIPIMCSECGFSQVFIGTGSRIRSEDEQASLVTRSVLVDLMSGIPLHIIYTNRDYTDKFASNEDRYGFCTRDGRPKRAFYAVQNLVGKLKNAQFVRRLTAGSVDIFEESPGDYVAEFSDNESRILVGWTTGEPHDVKVSLEDAPTAESNLYGESLPVPEVKEKFVKMGLSQSPIYLTIKRK
ncbi:hypothetical protein BH09VER1_BH09VER1_17310 [soil metagenome]